MKRMTWIALLGLLLIPFASEAQKKEKKEKEKKEVEWPGLPEKFSQEKELDDYILSCDTVWNRMQTYRDSVIIFKIDSQLVYDENAKMHYYAVKIRDEEGTEKNFSSVLIQSLQLTATGINIIGDASIINLKVISATAVLVSKPLLSLTYGKYIKTGPQIAGMAYNEFKTIVEAKKEESRVIKALRANQSEKSTDTTILIEIPEDEVEDPSQYLAINLEDFTAGESAESLEIPDELSQFAEMEIPVEK